MKDFLKILLLIINVVSFVFVLVFGATGFIYDLFGYAFYEKMLDKIGIPWNFNQIWIFCAICLIITVVVFIIRKKFFN